MQKYTLFITIIGMLFVAIDTKVHTLCTSYVNAPAYNI